MGGDPGSSRQGSAVQKLVQRGLRGCVSSGVKLSLRVRSEDASNCALVHSSRRISVFVVRTGFLLLFSAYTQILACMLP